MILPKYIKGAIFDLDGTLLDSLHAWADVDRLFFAKRGLPVPEGYYDAIKTMGLSEAAVYTKARCGLKDACEDMVAEWLSMIREEYACRIGMKEGAKDFLSELRTRGIALGIATSSSPELFLPCLKRHGVDGWFSAHALTSETRGKEHPDVYLLAAERLGLSPRECAVFEDIPEGVGSARAGGFFSVAVCPLSSPEYPMMKKTADEVIERF